MLRPHVKKIHIAIGSIRFSEIMLRAKSGLLHQLVDPAQPGMVVPRQMSEEAPGEISGEMHDYPLVVTFSAPPADYICSYSLGGRKAPSWNVFKVLFFTSFHHQHTTHPIHIIFIEQQWRHKLMTPSVSLKTAPPISSV